MRCPKCGKILFRLDRRGYVCSPGCGMVYYKDCDNKIEGKNKEAEEIEEDMEIWVRSRTWEKVK